MPAKKKKQERRQQIKDFVNQIPEADYDRAVSKFLRVYDKPTGDPEAQGSGSAHPAVAPSVVKAAAYPAPDHVEQAQKSHQIPRSAKPRLPKVEYIDLFHSPSEHKVYGALQRDSEAYGANTTRTRVSEMVKRTGLSEKTVRTAIHGLVRKLSLDILDPSKTPYGRLYRVYDQAEIKKRRTDAGMAIDHVTKQIMKLDG